MVRQLDHDVAAEEGAYLQFFFLVALKLLTLVSS